MTSPTWDHKACIVQVLVDDKSAGTGFVVDENLIATCAHVIDKNADEPPEHTQITVRFVGAPDVESVPVRLEPALWRCSNAEDVAFLHCDAVPPAVVVARLAEAGERKSQPCEAFGFPDVANNRYEGLGANATVIEHVKTCDGHRLIQLDSKQLTHGYSGAPLIDTELNCVIGMVVEIIDEKIRHLKGRHSSTAFATPSDVLKNVQPRLRLESEDLRAEHRKAIERLRARTAKELDKSALATDQLAQEIDERLAISAPAATEPKSKADAVVTTLFDRPLDDVLDVLIGACVQLGNDHSEDAGAALNTVKAVGHHIFPAVYDRDQLRQIRTSIVSGHPFIVLPSTSDTIVEILMAGTDGRKALFAGPLDPNNLPGGEYQLENPPESGIGQRDFDENFRDALLQALKVSTHFRDSYPGAINRALEIQLKRAGHRYYYVYSQLPERTVDQARDDVIGRLKEQFPVLVFFKKARPSNPKPEFDLVYQLQQMFGSEPEP